MTPLTAALVITACLALEGFFSGSEIALVQANRVALRSRAEGGHRGAGLALELLEDEPGLLATCLIGTNLAVVTWSTVATGFLLQFDLHGATAVLLVPLGLIFGEALPKSLFHARADEIAVVVSWPLRAARSLFRPALWVVGQWDGVLRRLFRPDVAPDLSRQELLDLLDEAEDGPIPESERRLIRGVLALADTTAADCMTPLIRVVAVAEGSTVAAAAEVAVRTRHSRLPVFHRRIDHIVGMVHQVDLLFIRDDSEPITRHLRPVRFVPEYSPADDLFREMRDTGEHFVVVVDEYGGCIGIVTLEDLLEELVGDIEDERTTARPRVIAQQDGTWLAPAQLEVDAASEALGVDLPEGPYDTLAGLMLFHLQRIPEAGAEIHVGGLTVVAEDVSDRGIRTVRFRGPQHGDGAGPA